ncbi:MAG: orotidine-5'-phosphate decarboxylase [Balneolales bacterium]
MNFDNKLRQSISETGSVLCVGLDPNPFFLPHIITTAYKDTATQVLEFCRGVIKASSGYACAYKINTAYFEALGNSGFEILGQVKEMIPPAKIVIADAKRGDVGHTAEQYKSAFFDVFNFDAITLSPLMGFDTLKPYLNAKDKAIFVLTLTSNKGAEDFFLRPFNQSGNLSCFIAENLKKLAKVSKTSLGMVIGATQDTAGPVLNKFPESHLLIPGVGAQGGSLKKLETVLRNHSGIPLISISRGILYPEATNGFNWKELVEKQSFYYHQQLQSISQKYV